MALVVDHVVIAVRDLAAAAADYEAAGFTVVPGGEHTGGATHNALVAFADGAYLELIAFKEPDRSQDHRWWEKQSKGEGTVDFALRGADLAAAAARLRAAGIVAQGPDEGGRHRPDGQRIAWRNLSLAHSDAPLPFLIEDLTPTGLRIPSGAATDHPLGVAGVAGLVLLAADLDRAAGPVAALLGDPGTPTEPTAGGRRAVRFALSAQWIDLVEPAADAEPLQRHRHERSPGPYEIVLAGAGGAEILLPAARLHGARFRITPAR